MPVRFGASLSVNLFILFGMMMLREAAGRVSNRTQVKLFCQTVVFELLKLVLGTGLEAETSSSHLLKTQFCVGHPELWED